MGQAGGHDAPVAAAAETLSRDMRKRSVTIAGHRTSVSVEDEFWKELLAIAERGGKSINGLIAEIDAARDRNLSSAIRLRVLAELKKS